MDVTERVRSTTIREQSHNLVDSLLVVVPVIPHGRSILEMSLWVSLLGMDEQWELGWVSDEEDWSVVADEILISLLSVDLDGKSSWISGGIGRSGLSSYS